MKKFFTKTVQKNLIYYGLCLLALIITPFLAAPVAPLFDWAGYSLMRDLFKEVFTMIFWAVELIVFNIIRKKLFKQASKTETVQASEEAVCIEQTSEQNVSENVSESVSVENLEEATAKKKKKRKIKIKRELAPLLPMRNVIILSAISIFCIFLISLQTGFQVKPIYDIGEKVTGYEILNKLGWLGANAAKSIWILLTLYCMDNIAQEVVLPFAEEKRKWLIPLITGIGVLIFGVIDIIFYENAFALTYLLFYVAFTAVYYLTKKNGLKSLLLIILIYLF